MSTATAPAPSRSSTHSTLSRLTFGGILRSEWIKLRSLRSTFWCYLLILVLNIGFAALVASVGVGSGGGPGDGSTTSTAAGSGMANATVAVTLGINFTVLIAAVLGALMITGEYGTGMIKSTFAADPRRLGALFGKAIVFGVVTFVVGLVSLVIATLVATPLLDSESNISIDWSDGSFWLALVGGAGFLALAGLISLFLGAIIRASAGGIAAGIGLLFVMPIVLQIFTGLTNAKWAANIASFLPSNAGGLMFGYSAGEAKVVDGIVTLDQFFGFVVMVGWVILTGILAVILVKRRDA
ncbi:MULTISPECIES: ABC transporter permease subunit [unclassified Frondihabitans]|uniref:ABC transporter permease subunit n=1 Tax=unclassified Frondihabitans TaxID=2626248 RepID=UPI000F4E151C|nr:MULTISPECIES: ABC transporter permease subunit [unclassified Frondihabitans]RPE78798.1 ABC-2 type transport system permease protein [Frondihabitans sp. PhB153]RPF09079.1 ABC-2 type transport system permease protein [Frondihabitans sp. PhB161]